MAKHLIRLEHFLKKFDPVRCSLSIFLLNLAAADLLHFAVRSRHLVTRFTYHWDLFFIPQFIFIAAVIYFKTDEKKTQTLLAQAVFAIIATILTLYMYGYRRHDILFPAYVWIVALPFIFLTFFTVRSIDNGTTKWLKHEKIKFTTSQKVCLLFLPLIIYLTC